MLKRYSGLCVGSTFLLLFACGNKKVDNNESTVKSYTNGYEQCNSVFEHGIYDEILQNISDRFTQDIAHRFCSIDAGGAESIYRNSLARALNSSAGENGKVGISVFGLFSVDSSVGGNSASGSNFSSDDFAKSFGEWKKQSCNESNSYTNNEFLYSVISKNPNANIVESWKQCVAKEHSGLSCWPTEEDGLVNVTVQWKAPMSHPQTLNLAWKTLHNVDIISTNLPSKIGQGEEIKVAFKVRDPKIPTKIDINASGLMGRNAMKYSCPAITIPAKSEDISLDGRPDVSFNTDKLYTEHWSMEVPSEFNGHLKSEGSSWFLHLPFKYEDDISPKYFINQLDEDPCEDAFKFVNEGSVSKFPIQNGLEAVSSTANTFLGTEKFTQIKFAIKDVKSGKCLSSAFYTNSPLREFISLNGNSEIEKTIKQVAKSIRPRS